MKMPLYRATWHYIAEIYVCNAKGKKLLRNFSGPAKDATFAATFDIKKMNITKTALLVMAMTIDAASTRAAEPTTFCIQIVNVINDDDDMLKEFPHRAPALADVSGTYEASSGTLSLSASFDVACVRIYKDGTLIMEDNHPVTDDGTLYYNLSFYGSGAYRICLFDEEGNSYMAFFTI